MTTFAAVGAPQSLPRQAPTAGQVFSVPTLDGRYRYYQAPVGSSVATNDDYPVPVVAHPNEIGVSSIAIGRIGFDGAAHVRFYAKVQTPTDGREEFFLIAADAAPVPEPASLAMLGVAELRLAFIVAVKSPEVGAFVRFATVRPVPKLTPFMIDLPIDPANV